MPANKMPVTKFSRQKSSYSVEKSWKIEVKKVALFLSKICSPKSRLSSPPCSNTCSPPRRASLGRLDRAGATGRQKRESTPRQLGARLSLYIQRDRPRPSRKLPEFLQRIVTKLQPNDTPQLLDTRRAACNSYSTRRESGER